MKNSIQRKSHQLSIFNDLSRKNKKYKTYTKLSLLNFKKIQKSKHFYAEAVVQSFLSQLIDNVYKIIWTKNKNQTLNKVTQDFLKLGNQFIELGLIQPMHSTSMMKLDIEPENILTDNFCGVDQGSNNNSEKLSKINKINIQCIKRCPKSSNQQKRGFLLSINKRKQINQIKSHNISCTSTSLDNSLQAKKVFFNLKNKSLSSQKLVPLLKSQSQDIQNIKSEQFFRDRLVKQTLNKKLNIKINQMNQGSFFLASNAAEEFNFDYDGSKINLLKGDNNKSYNNILKTVYNINNQKNEIKHHRIRASIKYRPSLNFDANSLPTRQKPLLLIKNSSQNQNFFNIKSKLQSSFKKQKINYRVLNV